jgi:hypothetical protein
MIDWNDDTLRPLVELARVAFPDGGVTGATLKFRARQGKLRVCRPGKAYLASLADVRDMIEACRVMRRPDRPTPSFSAGPLELSDANLASMALKGTIERIRENDRRARAEKKRLKAEELARTAPARMMAAKAKRSARSKERYQEQKRERMRDAG